MKIYKVGGAVRDKILGLKAQDNDYVVVGATQDEMSALGFKAVGKAFPVFLHPQTHEEYALARKEIKTGNKHTDFKFIFTPDVTLREDLERRDLTCNAIAFDEEKKEYIDYFDGRKDIQNKILRHINAEHFVEDPLRVLRVCRFAAQLDFEVADETLELCEKMVLSGAMENLTAERIFEELRKALKAKKSSKFFLMMREIGALAKIMPEIEVLFEVPEKEQYHPEKNTGGHVMTALDTAATQSELIKFAVLTHDVGKALTDKSKWPSHHGHADLALKPILDLCRRLKVPNIYKDFALKAAKYHMKYFDIFEMRPRKIYDLISAFIIGHKSYLEEYIEVCRADFEGSACQSREEGRKIFHAKAEFLLKARVLIDAIKASDVPNFEKLPHDEKFGTIFKEYKIRKLAEFMQNRFDFGLPSKSMKVK